MSGTKAPHLSGKQSVSARTFAGAIGSLAVSLIAAFLVWCWSRERCGENPALLATILFATTVLGHAGLATTDIAITATLTGTLEAIRSGGNSPIPFDELMEVSETTFAVEEAIGSGTRI